MKNKLFIYFLLFSGLSAFSQSKLTVEKIMQDPKWIGTSPTNTFWAQDNSKIYFSWNPDKNLGDSLYNYSLSTKKIEKVSPSEAYAASSSEGSYTLDLKKKVFAAHGDLFLFYPETNLRKQLTQTLELESNPTFTVDGQEIIFQKSGDIFSLNLNSGLLKQITDFEKGTKKVEKKKSAQEKWLETDQLAMFEILKERDTKEKATKANKYQLEIPKKIYLNENRISGTNPSPKLNFVAYSTIEAEKSVKSTIVPSYLTQSGFTEDLPARSKVGAVQSTYKSFIYDIKKDTVWKVDLSKLPGIKEQPKFLAEYIKADSSKKVDTTKKVEARKVILSQTFWSPLGTNLIGVVRSQDNKDRWIIRIDPNTGKVESLDRQHDEAWIAGPGIGWSAGGGSIGWLSENEIYFQSEESGYSHLYKLNIISKTV